MRIIRLYAYRCPLPRVLPRAFTRQYTRSLCIRVGHYTLHLQTEAVHEGVFSVPCLTQGYQTFTDGIVSKRIVGRLHYLNHLLNTHGIKKIEDYKCRRNITWTKLLCNGSDAPWSKLCWWLTQLLSGLLCQATEVWNYEFTLRLSWLFHFFGGTHQLPVGTNKLCSTLSR